MSDRIRTSGTGEEILKQLALALDPDRILDLPDKWRLMRLALGVSLRLPIPLGDSGIDLRQPDRSKGSEYRLKQVTGEGKTGGNGERAEDEDLTDTLRAMLGALHKVDLFLPSHRETTFLHLLEFHLERGLIEIGRKLAEDGDVITALIRLVAPPSSGVTNLVSDVTVERLIVALAEIGVPAEKAGNAVEGPRLSHVPIRVPDPNDLDRIERGLHRIAFALGLPQDSLSIEASAEPKTLTILVPRPRETWTVPGFPDLQRALGTQTGGLPVCLGVDTLGRTVARDLRQAPHVLIGGSTGSGKSMVLHAILCGLLLSCGKSELQLALCDVKGTELTPYRGAPQIYGEIATEPRVISKLLLEIVAEMDRRYPILQGGGHRDLTEARRVGRAFPSLVLVVDELADLILQLPEAEEGLIRIAQKGRAVGVHLVLATQRPDARTFSGLLRTNVPARVALAVQRSSESQIILGEPGAQALLSPGDMIIRWSAGDRFRAHGYDIRPDDVAHVVRATRRSDA